MDSINHLDIPGIPKILFGSGSYSRLPEIIAYYGSHALIVTGGDSLKRSGRWTPLTVQLNRLGIQAKALSVRGEPTTQAIDAITNEYRKDSIDVVVAIGGGSVIDCGKALSAMLASVGSIKDVLEGVGTRKPTGEKIPFVAVPTTAGTGSEATKNAVLCDRKEGYKRSLRHDAYLPNVALVDPKLTLSLPAPLTVAGGLDAVSQLIEAYTSVRADDATDSLAKDALACAAEALMPLALGQSNDLALREKMAYAALVSGILLNRSGLGAVHGLAGPLGGLFPIPHGVACGKLLFPVMSFVVKKVQDDNNLSAQKRFADIGRILTFDHGEGDDTFYCKRFLDVLNQWSQAMRLPQLSAFGVSAADFEKVIALADSKNSPVALTPKEMKVVLEIVR